MNNIGKKTTDGKKEREAREIYMSDDECLQKN